MPPVTKQKQQQQQQQQDVAASSTTCKPFKWLLHISILLVLVVAITVVSSYVLKQEHNDGTETHQISMSSNGTLGSADSKKLGNSQQLQQQLASTGYEIPTMEDSNSQDYNKKQHVGVGVGAGAGAGADGAKAIKTQVPVIGVLTQVLRDYKRFTKEHHLHIAASYVKWLESAGAQVVPILLNQNDYYYEQMFKQTNGLLFPGGDNLLDPEKSTPMMVAAKKLYRLAVDANDAGHYYPIWGTCLGLELLSVLSSNKNVLDSCVAIDDALPMNFVEQRGKLFAPSTYANLPELSADYSKVITSILSSKKLTYNYHRKCLSDAGLERAGLSDFYRPLAYSRDTSDNKFIAIFEAIRYPFYGVQFHPEKPAFEFVIKQHQYNIPHSREAIAVSRYFADFFVQQAQLNDHKIDKKLIQDHLIYAHSPMYTAPLHDMYEQRYLFPFGSDFGASTTEEFIEHLVSDDELVPEDVGGGGGLSGATAGPAMQSNGSSLELLKKVVDLPNASEGLPQRDFYILDNSTATTTTTTTTNTTNSSSAPGVHS